MQYLCINYGNEGEFNCIEKSLKIMNPIIIDTHLGNSVKLLLSVNYI